MSVPSISQDAPHAETPAALMSLAYQLGFMQMLWIVLQAKASIVLSRAVIKTWICLAPFSRLSLGFTQQKLPARLPVKNP